jgi:hypothetical protein
MPASRTISNDREKRERKHVSLDVEKDLPGDA